MSTDEMLESGTLTISIKEAADLLKVNPRLVSKECVAGSLPSIQLGRRRLVLLLPLLELLTRKSVLPRA
jgi:hypothetical protein